VATLRYLEHVEFTSLFLVHDKTLSILALMKIVQLPTEHLPLVFRNEGALQYLMKAMLTFFKTLPEAQKRILAFLFVWH